MKWNVFCNENAPYRIYYRQIEIDGYEMYVMFPLPMTGMECGWAVSHGATTAATIQEAVQKFYPFMVEYICDKEDSDNDTQQYILKNLNSLGNSVDIWGRKNDRQHVIDGMSATQKSQLLCYILRNHEAFVKTFDDDWTPMSTPLKAYKKDMRSIKPAGNYEEGKDYMVAVSPWVLEAFLKANQIDYVQLIRGQDLKNPPVGSIRYANEKEVVWYEYSSATTTRRCTDLSRAKSFVQEWVNLDCPTLKRFSTNQKVLSVNGFGVAVPLFESPLVGANRRKLSWLDITAPTFSQSINVQRYGAELIKKLVKERLGIELYYRSELD